jgi:isopentenyl diphosphate isomerase/L-lactate dehydrogenase-like FMN-dependent dehydrogenase
MRAARLRRMAGVEDFRRAARRRLPRIFADYIEGGASGEVTLAANTADFDRILLRPRVLRDVSLRDLSATFLGARHALPLMLGPVGSLGLFRAGAEAAAFRAAAAAGIPACLSSFAVTRPEALAPVVGEAAAFQLYMLKDRDRTEAMLDRVARAGFGTLFVTVDTAVSGIRERDIRNGLRQMARPDLRMLADFARHPRWLADMARAHPFGMALAEGWAEAGRGYLAQAGFLAGQIDPALDGPALSWLRERWRGRLIVKGVQAPEDALECAGRGADGIVVSNHGGRQLDGVPSSIAVLAPIAQALAGRIEVLFDGGIRRGGDVAKALALGASACLLGRAYVWGAAAAGEAGVREVLAALAAELDATLALLGLRSLAELRDAGTDVLRLPADWG